MANSDLVLSFTYLENQGINPDLQHILTFPQLSELFAQPVVNMIQNLGIQCYMQNTPVNWDGERLNVFNIWNSSSDVNELNSITIHDLCHWILSLPEHRTLPEFGLGPSPDYERHSLPDHQIHSTITEEETILNEESACHLGVMIERYTRLNWELSQNRLNTTITSTEDLDDRMVQFMVERNIMTKCRNRRLKSWIYNLTRDS